MYWKQQQPPRVFIVHDGPSALDPAFVSPVREVKGWYTGFWHFLPQDQIVCHPDLTEIRKHLDLVQTQIDIETAEAKRLMILKPQQVVDITPADFFSLVNNAAGNELIDVLKHGDGTLTVKGTRYKITAGSEQEHKNCVSGNPDREKQYYDKAKQTGAIVPPCS